VKIIIMYTVMTMVKKASGWRKKTRRGDRVKRCWDFTSFSL